MLRTEDPSWPDFLNELQTDLDAAMAGFYSYAIQQLRCETPKPLRYIPAHLQCDAVSDFIVHCFKDDLCVLKRYVNKGRTFAGWLHLVATNFFISWIRRNLNPRYSFVEFDPENSTGRRTSGLDEQFELSDLLEKISRIIGRLGEKCRLLLKLAAEEFEIKEIVTLMRYPKVANVKISNDLRYCRKKLVAELGKEGVLLAEYLPKRREDS